MSFDKKGLEEYQKKRDQEEMSTYGRLLTWDERQAILDEKLRQQRESEKIAELKEQKKREEVEKRKWYEEKVLTIPPRYKEVLNNPTIFAQTAFEVLKDGRHDAVIFGENGTGKTFLSWALVNEVWKLGKDAIYVTSFQMLNDIKRTYSQQELTQTVKNKYTKPQLLIIDEMDKTRNSQDEFINLFDIVDTRYNNFKSTIVITNSPQSEVVKTVGKAVFSRLGKGGQVFTLTGNDKRGQK